MRVIIVEDEQLAVDRLQRLLHQMDASIEVVAIPEDVTLESLTKALHKINLLQGSMVLPVADGNGPGGPGAPGPVSFKSRFLGRIGQRLFFINAGDIAMISANNRIVHIITMDKTRYLVDHTLDDLEKDLEPSAFFRINRSTIVHARAIEQIKPFINHRLKLVLKNPLQTEELIVSRDRVSDFKKWAES